MKTIIFFLFISFNIFSQNRYTEITPSSYEPTYINYNNNNYHNIQKSRIKNINEGMEWMSSALDDYDNKETDEKFVSDMNEVKKYFNILAKAENMSLDTAELYLEKMYIIHNKAVKDYLLRIEE